MIKKKLVYRQCIVTKKLCLREDLIRIVRLKDNSVMIDLDNKILGHGFYLQKKVNVFQELKKRMLLEKIFKCEKNNLQIIKIYELLAKIIIKDSEK